MSPRSNIILWLVATVAIAGLTAWAVTTRVPPARTNSGASITPPSELSLHDWMHQHLGISAEQHHVLDPLETTYEASHVRLRQNVRQLGTELAIAIRDAAPPATVFTAQEKLNAAQGELQQATLQHFIEMKQHLTPGQAQKLAEWTHDSILLQPGN